MHNLGRPWSGLVWSGLVWSGLPALAWLKMHTLQSPTGESGTTVSLPLPGRCINFAITLHLWRRSCCSFALQPPMFRMQPAATAPATARCSETDSNGPESGVAHWRGNRSSTRQTCRTTSRPRVSAPIPYNTASSLPAPRGKISRSTVVGHSLTSHHLTSQHHSTPPLHTTPHHTTPCNEDGTVLIVFAL